MKASNSDKILSLIIAVMAFATGCTALWAASKANSYMPILFGVAVIAFILSGWQLGVTQPSHARAARDPEPDHANATNEDRDWPVGEQWGEHELPPEGTPLRINKIEGSIHRGSSYSGEAFLRRYWIVDPPTAVKVSDRVTFNGDGTLTVSAGEGDVISFTVPTSQVLPYRPDAVERMEAGQVASFTAGQLLWQRMLKQAEATIERQRAEIDRHCGVLAEYAAQVEKAAAYLDRSTPAPDAFAETHLQQWPRSTIIEPQADQDARNAALSRIAEAMPTATSSDFKAAPLKLYTYRFDTPLSVLEGDVVTMDMTADGIANVTLTSSDGVELAVRGVPATHTYAPIMTPPNQPHYGRTVLTAADGTETVIDATLPDDPFARQAGHILDSIDMRLADIFVNTQMTEDEERVIQPLVADMLDLHGALGRYPTVVMGFPAEFGQRRGDQDMAPVELPDLVPYREWMVEGHWWRQMLVEYGSVDAVAEQLDRYITGHDEFKSPYGASSEELAGGVITDAGLVTYGEFARRRKKESGGETNGVPK